MRKPVCELPNHVSECVWSQALAELSTRLLFTFLPLNVDSSSVGIAPSISQRRISVAEHTYVRHYYGLFNWECCSERFISRRMTLGEKPRSAVTMRR